MATAVRQSKGWSGHHICGNPGVAKMEKKLPEGQETKSLGRQLCDNKTRQPNVTSTPLSLSMRNNGMSLCGVTLSTTACRIARRTRDQGPRGA